MAGGAGVYLPQDQFLSGAFDGNVPAPKTLWLSTEQRNAAAGILGHPYASLRVRYWQNGERIAFILNEIGKEKPITIGLVVENNALRSVKILEFRESRGWEVKSPAFTDQFTDGKLAEDHKLDRRIDGITGATLSVRAVTKVSRLALTFYEYARQEKAN